MVEDTRLYGLDNPSRLEVYLPLAQSVRDGMTLVVKAASDPASLVPSIRAVVSSIHRDQPISDVASMNDLLDASVSTRRQTFVLLALFSGLALALAAIGIYGVMSCSVAQRTNELASVWRSGRGGRTWRAVLGQGLWIAGAGIALGLAAALGERGPCARSSSRERRRRGHVRGVGVGVALVALAACAVPGWRAVRVDPQWRYGASSLAGLAA